MPGCAVFGCSNYSRKTKGTEIRYFGFPKDDNLTKRWINACHRKDAFNVKHARICSVHFKKSDFKIPLKQQLLNYTPKNNRNLKDDAVPTLSLPSSKEEVKCKSSIERSERISKREKQNEIKEIFENIKNIPCTDHNKENEEFEDIIPCTYHTSQNEEITNDSELYDDTINFLKNKIAVLEDENSKLKVKCEKLQLEKSELLLQLNGMKNESEAFMEKLKSIFTTGQINAMMKSKKKCRWKSEDIAAAISLRCVSPKAYRYLRYHNYPLPALSTLRKWVMHLNLKKGILKDVIFLMKNKSCELNSLQRLTVLSFDEIHLSNRICVDIKNEQILGPHKCCQTVMARGLCGQWKQPVYYDFDKPMTQEILKVIISNLYEVGFIVVAITCDMGTRNMGVWSELNVGYDQECYFNHPSDDYLKVFVFCDVPHLLKLVRNHFLDQGFTIKGKFVDKSCIEYLLSASSTEITIAHKISQYHLDLKGSERQRVRPAAQLLSNTIAKAIEYCGINDKMKNYNWRECQKFIKLTNDWFDLFNAKTKFGADPGCNAFGTDIDNQISLLNEVSSQISEMTVGKGKRLSLLPFQKGILLNNKSLIQMYHYLKSRYDIQYIITYRLNQDVLENFFSYIRGMGCQNDHPTPLDFKYRLRWYILGKHSSAVFTQNNNTMENNEVCLVEQTGSDTINDEICITQRIIPKIFPVINTSTCEQDQDRESLCFDEASDDLIQLDLPNFDMTIDHINLLENFEQYEFKDYIHNEGLKYISGYVAHRFRNKYSYLGVPTKDMEKTNEPSWIQFLSKGNLIHPNSQLMQATAIMEKEFNALHGSYLSSDKLIFKTLASRTNSKLPPSFNIPFEVLCCLARTRTYIRLQILNRKLSSENSKRRLHRKMSKFTNNKITKSVVKG